MKRKFKAFTLIELIVVMAIMSILMVALMNFYKPIRETYVDSSMIEDMRTTQDGILEYLAENVKYAEKLMIFDDDSRYVSSYEYTDTTSPTGKSEKKINMPINSPKDAYDAFCIEYGLIKDDATATPDYNTMSGSEGKYIKSLEQIHIIVINRSALYDINGNVVSGADAAEKGYNGRVITNIIDKDKSAWNFYARDFGNAYGQRPAGNSTGTTYMALGGAYYGKSNYNIYINEDETIWSASSSGSPSITFTVENSFANENGVIKNGNTYGNSKLKTDGGNVTLSSNKAALMKNLSSIDYYTGDNATGKNKVGEANAAIPAGNYSDAGVLQIKGKSGSAKNTYIVYLDPGEDR